MQTKQLPIIHRSGEYYETTPSKKFKTILPNNKSAQLNEILISYVFVYIRIVMPGSQRQQSDLHLGHATLKEGEMWGRSMANINRWVNGDGKLIIKFLCNPGDSYGKKTLPSYCTASRTQCVPILKKSRISSIFSQKSRILIIFYLNIPYPDKP